MKQERKKKKKKIKSLKEKWKKKKRKISSDFLSFWQYNYWLESGGDDGGGVFEKH